MEGKNVKQLILVDAAALNKVAFDIIVNFERMLNRRLPRVDMRKWLFAAACDGNFVHALEPVSVVMLVKNGAAEFANLDFEFLENVPAESIVDCEGYQMSIEMRGYDGDAGHALVEIVENLNEEFPRLNDLVCVPREDISQYTARLLAGMRMVRPTLLTPDMLRGTGFAQEFISCSISYALGITGDDVRDADWSHCHCH